MELAENLPDGSSQKKVVAMEVKGKKKGSLAGNSICNTEVLYSCVICLLNVGQLSLEDSPFSMSYPKFLCPCLQLHETESFQKIKQRRQINLRLNYREEML